MEILLKKTDPTNKVYVNKASSYIEIESKTFDFQFPYLIVNYTYQDNSNRGAVYIHSVNVSCPANVDCGVKIKGSSGKTALAITVPFQTKEDAYKFLDLIDQLKKQK